MEPRAAEWFGGGHFGREDIVSVTLVSMKKRYEHISEIKNSWMSDKRLRVFR